MGGLIPLSASTATLLSLALAQAQNSTVSAANITNIKLGWQDGPSQRGTSSLIWSCLSTVVASTWTILHLNVPGRSDGAWTRSGRKAKWMLVTILFPEFVFSKAVCELQMALDDLHAMKNKEYLVKWKVEFGVGLQFLHNLFHFFGSSPNSGTLNNISRDREQITGSCVETPLSTIIVTNPSTHSYDPILLLPDHDRVWTLTHSYFANMGGLERYRSSEFFIPLTAHAIVNCCVGTDHDPLPTLALQKVEIEDKAKADWFLKSIAVAQISWLIMSVIARATMKLPISQLEICTTAFAILAVATYLANWSKPKDIVIPVRFKVVADTYECEAYKYHSEQFIRRLLMPSQSSGLRIGSRISNDSVRLEGLIPPMSITMAVSTILFGGLHCLAWTFEFPTKTELMVWMVASVASATIPTAALIANMIVISSIHHAIQKCSGVFRHELMRRKVVATQKLYQRELRELFERNRSLGGGNVELHHGDEAILTCRQELSLMPQEIYKWDTETSIWLEKGIFLEHLLNKLSSFYADLMNFMHLGIHHSKFFTSYEDASQTWSEWASRIDVWDEAQLEQEVRLKLQSIRGITPVKMEYLIHLVRHPEILGQEKAALQRVLILCDQASRVIAIVGGILYGVVRIILLALAFVALRSVPDGLYASTWARFFPNIS